MSGKPERLLLRIPKRLWLLKRGLGFCMPRKNVRILFSALIAVGVYLGVSNYYAVYHLSIPFLSILILEIIWTIIFLLTVLLALPTIFIRKDCSECQLGFHIIAHERNHLLLNSTDETYVEEETLKQTRDQSIPILLSNPKLCKDCVFPWLKLYSQATFDYLKRSHAGKEGVQNRARSSHNREVFSSSLEMLHYE